ncbi:MAG: sulfate adenylyltransferase subunit CysN [Proteobacteria bacterium]|jgi:bifunctional enzyme CysN/CysC|nr:sulfate adenylyltransferase subunit CysN [Pseudomonadota bacterium]
MKHSTAINQYLKEQASLDLLRFITCGSVDDGKSTLIGRMLYESQMIFDDQVASLKKDSQKHGTQGEEIDFALLVDGLSAEREQGITIDVAYRFFSSSKRKFIVADTPGHEQYTRNMATGASTADLAILLVDARHGVVTQTKRHSFIVSLLGIKNVILAINKMDLVNYDQKTFQQIDHHYRDFAKNLNFKHIQSIPISALKGDNVYEKSKMMKWYSQQTLFSYLETVQVTSTKSSKFILPVQRVNRPNLDFRGYSGTIASGSIKVGEEIRTVPSNQKAKVKEIFIGDKSIKSSTNKQSITLTLNKEIDISRGDIICKKDSIVESADQFNINMIWMSEENCFPGRSYIAKIHNSSATIKILDIKKIYNVNTLEHSPGKQLDLNDVAEVTVSLGKNIPFMTYQENKNMGSMILIDPLSNQTIGVGMINFALRRAQNIHLQSLSITKELREKMNGHKGQVLWLTGLSGSGKSTIANALEKELYAEGKKTYVLDGDNIRHGLNKDLGFNDKDRVENIRRVAEVAKLMCDAGLIVITAFISPFRTERDMARSLFQSGEFKEIFISTPLNIAEQRDPKGLYKKARKGEIPNFTGINSPYEKPLNPELSLDTSKTSITQCVKKIREIIA